jgi:hypothetical protein
VTKPPRRPRDLNQWAKDMVDLATGAATDEVSAGEPKSPTTNRKRPGPEPNRCVGAISIRPRPPWLRLKLLPKP